jgi:hypothetical protein
VEPRCVHLIVAKQAMRYLKGKLYYGLFYIGYCDLDCMTILIQIGLEVLQIEK